MDPHYSDEEIISLGLSPCADFGSVEAVILHTDHPEFLGYSAADFPRLTCVVDGGNFLDSKDWGAATLISLGKPQELKSFQCARTKRPQLQAHEAILVLILR